MYSENDIGKQIQMLSRKITRKLNETFLSYKITGVQAFILKYIYENSKNKKIYAKDLRQEFDLRKPTITGILQIMQQNDLIERKTQGKDARLKEITITKKASDIVNKIDLSIREVENKLLENISKEEISYFLSVLKKMSTNL